MATYNTAFGALPSTKTLTGRTNTVGATPEDERRPRNFTQQFGAQRQGGQQQPAQTFAQLQQQGMARPAQPTAPTAPKFGRFGESEQAQELRTQLKEQLGKAAQAPSRFDTPAFQQIRSAQQANLQAEFGAQRKALDEEMARRGLFASSVTAGRMGDLAGQQARAAADIDAQLLQRAAETQAQDRAQLMQQFQGLSELAGAQDLAAFEANRVAQAAEAEQALRTAQFRQGQFEAGGAQALSAAQAQEAAARGQAELAESALERQLRERLGLMEATGNVYTAGVGGAPAAGTTRTLAAEQQRLQARQVAFQQAAAMSEQSGIQHTVNADNTITQLRNPDGSFVQTSEAAQASLNRQAQRDISEAELGLRERLGLAEATGTVYAPDQQGRLVPGTQQTIQARQLAFQNAARLSEQSGVQYTVNALGQPEIVRDAAGNPVRTSAFTQAEEQRKQQETLANLDVNLRRQLGLTEATGQMYNIDPATGRATLAAGAPQTLSARQQELALAQFLTQQTGNVYQLGPTGLATAVTTPSGVPATSIAGQEASFQRAQAMAENMSQQSGTQYEVVREPSTGMFSVRQVTGQGGAPVRTEGSALQRQQAALLQAQLLSEITGQQYTIDASGNAVARTGTGGAALSTERARQSDLERTLRQALGMSEVTGFVYDPATGGIFRPTGGTSTMETVAGQQARSDLMLRLSQALSGLSADQIARLLGNAGNGGGNDNNNNNNNGGGGGDFIPENTTSHNGQAIGSGFAPPQAASAGDYFRINGILYRFDGTSWRDRNNNPWRSS